MPGAFFYALVIFSSNHRRKRCRKRCNNTDQLHVFHRNRIADFQSLDDWEVSTQQFEIHRYNNKLTKIKLCEGSYVDDKVRPLSPFHSASSLRASCSSCSTVVS